MECPKCHGLMVVEQSYDYYLRRYASRCINCGTIIQHSPMSKRRPTVAGRTPRRWRVGYVTVPPLAITQRRPSDAV